MEKNTEQPEKVLISIDTKHYSGLLARASILDEILETMGKSNLSNEFKSEHVTHIIKETGVTLFSNTH